MKTPIYKFSARWQDSQTVNTDYRIGEVFYAEIKTRKDGTEYVKVGRQSFPIVRKRINSGVFVAPMIFVRDSN